jgi:predicted nucleic acid-binding protein
MTVEAVLDTNILVYAASTASAEAAKAKVAEALLGKGDVGISGQVLQEFFVTVTRKGTTPLTADEALDWIETFEDLPCAPVDARLVRHGIDIARRYRISYWDGAILAAAERLGAPILYTEDLNHDQTYGSVRVVNPFRAN